MYKACFVSFTGCPGIAPTSGSGPSPFGDTKDTVKEMFLYATLLCVYICALMCGVCVLMIFHPCCLQSLLYCHCIRCMGLWCTYSICFFKELAVWHKYFSTIVIYTVRTVCYKCVSMYESLCMTWYRYVFLF